MNSVFSWIPSSTNSHYPHRTAWRVTLSLLWKNRKYTVVSIDAMNTMAIIAFVSERSEPMFVYG